MDLSLWLSLDFRRITQWCGNESKLIDVDLPLLCIEPGSSHAILACVKNVKQWLSCNQFSKSLITFRRLLFPRDFEKLKSGESVTTYQEVWRKYPNFPIAARDSDSDGVGFLRTIIPKKTIPLFCILFRVRAYDIPTIMVRKTLSHLKLAEFYWTPSRKSK